MRFAGEGFLVTNDKRRNFFRNFYYDSMEDWERDADRPLVHDFVARVLALLDLGNGRE